MSQTRREKLEGQLQERGHSQQTWAQSWVAGAGEELADFRWFWSLLIGKGWQAWKLARALQDPMWEDRVLLDDPMRRCAGQSRKAE